MDSITEPAEHDAASAGPVKLIVRVDPGADRAGAGVHQVAFAGGEAVEVGDFDVVAQRHSEGAEAQQLGQPALQLFAVAAETGQAGAHAARPAMQQHGPGQH